MDNFSDLGFAKPDTGREVRQGAGEVIFGQGKSATQIVSIAKTLMGAGQKRVLVTRVDADKARQIATLWSHETVTKCERWEAAWARSASGEDGPQTGAATPAADGDRRFFYDECGRIGYMGAAPVVDGDGSVAVVAAGTSDLPVALEAAYTASFLGNSVFFLVDVGVAGIHRLLAYTDAMRSCSAIVAVAGMDGALASAIGGLVSAPVIAVPTSVGYGASFGGLAALLTMLNSCASGVSVVNIDNGFGAAFQASLINHLSRGA